MSDKQWKEILLDELHTLRLVCQYQVGDGQGQTKVCGTIIEIPTDKLAQAKQCPMCQNHIHSITEKTEDPFILLPRILSQLKNLPGVKISFAIPEND